MRHLWIPALAAILCAPLPAAAQSLVGVWRAAEVIISDGPDAGQHTTDVQPGLFIFTPRHYSVVAVERFEPRPRLSENPTDEERGRVFRHFMATRARTTCGATR